MQHIRGRIFQLRLAEIGIPPIGALLFLGQFLAREVAHQILEPVPVGVGAHQLGGDLGADHRCDGDAEGLLRAARNSGRAIEVELVVNQGLRSDADNDGQLTVNDFVSPAASESARLVASSQARCTRGWVFQARAVRPDVIMERYYNFAGAGMLVYDDDGLIVRSGRTYSTAEEITAGLAPPASGHPRFSRCADDIDRGRGLEQRLDRDVPFWRGLEPDERVRIAGVELPLLAVALGERAFEIDLARRVAAGEAQTAWFERHGSTPRTVKVTASPAGTRPSV